MTKIALTMPKNIYNISLYSRSALCMECSLHQTLTLKVEHHNMQRGGRFQAIMHMQELKYTAQTFIIGIFSVKI